MKLRRTLITSSSIDNVTKTRYEWTQEHRRIETAIRERKNVANLAKASGDDVLRREAQAHINQLDAAYARISDRAGLYERRDRMSVAGFRWLKPLESLQSAVENGILNVGERPPALKSLTDVAARRWYLAHDIRIPSLIDSSKSIEQQARQVCALRNQCRTLARDFMADQEKRKLLDEKFPNKTFEELVEDKMQRKNMSYEQAMQDILDTATKTNKEINKKLGLEDDSRVRIHNSKCHE